MILIQSLAGEFDGILKLDFSDVRSIHFYGTGNDVERVYTHKPHYGIIKFKDDVFKISYK